MRLSQITAEDWQWFLLELLRRCRRKKKQTTMKNRRLEQCKQQQSLGGPGAIATGRMCKIGRAHV